MDAPSVRASILFALLVCTFSLPTKHDTAAEGSSQQRRGKFHLHWGCMSHASYPTPQPNPFPAQGKKTSCVGAVQYMRSYESCFSPLHCLGGRSWSGDDGWLWAAHAATQKRSAATPSLDVMWPAGKVPYVFDDRVGTFTFRRLG